MTNRMNVLVSSNDAYVMPLTVLLQSLFETNTRPITIYFLYSGLSHERGEFLERFVAEHDSEIVFLPVGENEFKKLPTKEYISHETYYRLLAAELLPADTDRVLWLDADMVVNGPISALYDEDFGESTVIACPHGPAMRSTILEDCSLLGIAHPEQYFNAGVMLCNLDAWRDMDIRERIMQISATPRKMMFPGQDLTNLIFNGRVKTEDWRIWNCMIHSVEPEEIPQLKESARIIHYVGSVKPWNFTTIPFEDVWTAWYDRSPFANQPLKRTSFAKMRMMYERMQKAKGNA